MGVVLGQGFCCFSEVFWASHSWMPCEREAGSTEGLGCAAPCPGWHSPLGEHSRSGYHPGNSRNSISVCGMKSGSRGLCSTLLGLPGLAFRGKAEFHKPMVGSAAQL